MGGRKKTGRNLKEGARRLPMGGRRPDRKDRIRKKRRQKGAGVGYTVSPPAPNTVESRGRQAEGWGFAGDRTVKASVG